MEIFGLTILAIVAIVLFVLGLGLFKVNPLVGFIAGILIVLALGIRYTSLCMR